MRIGRTLPPAATPIGVAEVVSGIRGICNGEKELERFRSELKEHFGVRHCFLVSSGKAALTLILLALKELYPDRDEVLIPAFTCYSVPSSIVRANLEIRLCDQNPEDFDFDFSQLSLMLQKKSPAPTAAVSGHESTGLPVGRNRLPDNSSGSISKLLAVVSTHLFGFPADVERLREAILDPAVTVVEDAAQAMGETWKGRKLGTLGDVGFFSLGRGKAFSVVEGGVIVTNRDDIGEVLDSLVGQLPGYGKLALLKVIFKALALMVFIHPRLFWLPKSIPFLKLGETLYEPDFPILQMSSFQAGLARNWRRTLEQLRDARMKQVNSWVTRIGVNRLEALIGRGSLSLGLPRFPVRVRDGNKRDVLLQESTREGRGVMPVYPTSINAIPELKGKIPGGPFPFAESCPSELVTLPTHGYLTDEDIKEIGGLVSSALE